jgi:hypothetical protein
MRTLKFRMYDEKYNTWVNDPLFVYPSTEIVKQGIVFQQFTGCFDKNNKEIYEGDLVKVTSPYTNDNCIATVIYGEAEFCFKVNDGDIKGCWSGDDVEVIGNIFENEP